MSEEIHWVIQKAVFGNTPEAAEDLEKMRNHLERRDTLLQGQNERAAKKEELKEVLAAMAGVQRLAVMDDQRRQAR